MYTIDMVDLDRPYPNKCYLPFILYPPGMHRNTEGEAFLSRLKALDEQGEDFVLYLGVPFCRTRCKSCPYFISLLPENDQHNREDAYVEALIKDLEHWATFRRWRTGLVRNIYIGGGTGSVLRTDNLKRLVDKIFSLFRVADDYEFTLEGNARDFDDEKIDFLVGSKINRLSLGVQSFQPEILATIGSPHAAEDSIRVIRAFQSRGFKNIQLDLMYNMPGHTLNVWRRDLKTLNDLDIPHFTIYLYRIHKQTPQDKLITKGKVVQPQDAETPMVKAMYTQAKDIAEAMGFTMYMVDHFCKPGFENMYNHWNWKAYIDTLAVGPGSYSYFDGYRLGTDTDVEGYVSACNKGQFVISSVTDKLSPRVQRERYVIFALLYYEIEFSFYRSKFGSSLLKDFASEIERLTAKDLIDVLPDRITLTQLGLIWHTNIILEFFNQAFWSDTASLNEPNWSLNGVMVEVGAHERSYWLGDPVLADPNSTPYPGTFMEVDAHV
ncbi:Fe-S oxidoreductase, coproporphyrinogen III oxidase [Hoeflea sp. IMCC20628]|uniref:coproporphyrinogen-III oxidase family protein n=1 Tax=Hoeflea sp. IMCC20628 TaxID=1620421 RepID=UPI00063ACABB|nr:coproporphyrinogen-III oxidase family protein [Hoeflea sp. IMCC20628]AKI01941.1 Fe-S oxidoreductase, coproporphyrinogen III oxidase [Hoeflea sp. IMCC20628]